MKSNRSFYKRNYFKISAPESVGYSYLLLNIRAHTRSDDVKKKNIDDTGSDILERRGARCVGNVIPRRRSQLTAFLPLILLIQGYGNNRAGGERRRRESLSCR